MNMIKEFERNNAIIKEQKKIDQRKINEVRDLIKKVKNELMKE